MLQIDKLIDQTFLFYHKTLYFQFEIDFKALYPDALDKIFSHWESFVEKPKKKFAGIKLPGNTEIKL